MSMLCSLTSMKITLMARLFFLDIDENYVDREALFLDIDENYVDREAPFPGINANHPDAEAFFVDIEVNGPASPQGGVLLLSPRGKSCKYPRFFVE